MFLLYEFFYNILLELYTEKLCLYEVTLFLKNMDNEFIWIENRNMDAPNYK